MADNHQHQCAYFYFNGGNDSGQIPKCLGLAEPFWRQDLSSN